MFKDFFCDFNDLGFFFDWSETACKYGKKLYLSHCYLQIHKEYTRRSKTTPTCK